jgi:hypothetical protein
MKSTSIAIIVSLVTGVTPALAASGARDDNSGFLVWAFLGVCALIVVAQILPAAMTLMGFAKGVKKDVVAKENATH